MTFQRAGNEAKKAAIEVGIPVVPGFITIKREFTVGGLLESLAGLFGTRLDISADLTSFILDTILQDLYAQGDALGGWGKRYPDYLSERFQGVVPKGVSSQPDSLTFTVWVVEGLTQLAKHADKSLQLEIAKILEKTRAYLDLHYNLQTGGAGLVVRTSTLEMRIAEDLRHTIACVQGYHILGARLDRIVKSADWVLEYLRRHDVERELAFTIAQALSFLYWTADTRVLLRGLAHEDMISRLIRKAEAALLNHYDKTQHVWDSGLSAYGPQHIFPALCVLHATKKLQSSANAEVRAMYASALDRLIAECLVSVERNQLGCPFRTGEQPDVGTTIVFLEVLASARTIGVRLQKRLLNQCGNFIKAQYRNPAFTRHSYSWLLARIFKLVTAEGG